MTELREEFTENAEQFDALMVRMLAENTRLAEDVKWLRGQLTCIQNITDKLGIIGEPGSTSWNAQVSRLKL